MQEKILREQNRISPFDFHNNETSNYFQNHKEIKDTFGVFNHLSISMLITLFLFNIFLHFQGVLITNLKKFSSNLRLLFSKSKFKMKFKVKYKSNNMKLISIFCHCILIAICINYLIESRSIQVFEKRGNELKLGMTIRFDRFIESDFLQGFPDQFKYFDNF